jgi:hypothetical protein
MANISELLYTLLHRPLLHAETKSIDSASTSADDEIEEFLDRDATQMALDSSKHEQLHDATHPATIETQHAHASKRRLHVYPLIDPPRILSVHRTGAKIP